MTRLREFKQGTKIMIPNRMAFITAVIAVALSHAIAHDDGELPEGFVDQFVAGDFDEPIAVAFLPNPNLFEENGMLVLQKNGVIKWVHNRHRPDTDISEYMSLTNIATASERGLLDICFDPDFANNGYFYLYYSHCYKGQQFACDQCDDERIDLPNDGADPTPPILSIQLPCYTARPQVSRFEHIPATGFDVDDAPEAHPAGEYDPSNAFLTLGDECVVWRSEDPYVDDFHHGGSIDFGPDGMLYIVLGDQFDELSAAMETSTRGSVVRIDPQSGLSTGQCQDVNIGPVSEHFGDDIPIGEAPVGGGAMPNPWFDSGLDSRDPENLVVARGLRNPFRSSWDLNPGTERLMIGEVGGNNALAREDLHRLKLLPDIDDPSRLKRIDFGWGDHPNDGPPRCEGPCNTKGAPPCPEDPFLEKDYPCSTIKHFEECYCGDITTVEGIELTRFEGPVLSYDRPSSIGNAIVGGDAYHVNDQAGAPYEFIVEDTCCPTSQPPAYQYDGLYFFAEFTGSFIGWAEFCDPSCPCTGSDCRCTPCSDFPDCPPNTHCLIDTDLDFYVNPGTFDEPGPTQGVIFVEKGPDGGLYYVSRGRSEVRRIAYPNGPVLADTSVNVPQTPTLPVTLNVRASATDMISSDIFADIDIAWTIIHPDGSNLTRFGEAVNIPISHSVATFTIPNDLSTYNPSLPLENYFGTYTLIPEATDIDSITSFGDPLTVSVGMPPVVEIESPVNGTLFDAESNSTINISATAFDPDGDDANILVRWSVGRTHSGTHTHPIAYACNTLQCSQFDVPDGSTPGKNIDEFSVHEGYEFRVTVTDEQGIDSSDVVTVFADTRRVSFDSVVPGLEVSVFSRESYGSNDSPLIEGKTPFSFSAVVGYRFVVELVWPDEPTEPTCINGRQYSFDNWSDGNGVLPPLDSSVDDNIVELVVPNVDYSVTANVSEVDPDCPFIFIPSIPEERIEFHVVAEVGPDGLSLVSGTNTVQSWSDRSGENDLTYVTGDPTYIVDASTGRGFVEFDGVGDAMGRNGIVPNIAPAGSTCADQSVLGTTLPEDDCPRQIFMVARYHGNSNPAIWSGFTYGHAVENEALGLGLSGDPLTDKNLGLIAGGNRNYFSDVISNNKWILHTAARSAFWDENFSGLAQFRNAELIQGVNSQDAGWIPLATNIDSGGTIRLAELLGGSGGIDVIPIDIAEIIVTSVPNDFIVEGIETYLMDRYIDSLPITQEDEASVRPGESVLIDVTANDYDPEGPVALLSIDSNPFHGSATLEGGKIRFTANEVAPDGLLKTESVNYSIVDLFGGTATGTLSIQIMCPFVNSDNVVHVDKDSLALESEQDGLSWATAYSDLNRAMMLSCPGDEVWVAEGVYVPDATGMDRTASFVLKDEVSVLGGFTGVETSADQRNPELNVTVLSGDLLGNDVSQPTTGKDENSFHVVDGTGVNSSAILDGFTITGGNASALGRDSIGGGLIILDDVEEITANAGSPTIENCVFDSNSADSGAGAAIVRGNPTFRNCSFWNNIANNNGGGVLVAGEFSSSLPASHGRAVFNSVEFFENSATNGGAAFINNAGPLFVSSVFVQNDAIGSSSSNGGAIHASCDENCSPSVRIINSTFRLNNAEGGGGGLFAAPSNSTTVANSIFWDNTDSTPSLASAQIDDTSGDSVEVVYSVWQNHGGDVSLNIIDEDPLFDGIDAEDIGLGHASPCIDAADATRIPFFAQLDVRSNNRLFDDIFEPDTGAGTPNYLDIGAVEYIQCERDCDCYIAAVAKAEAGQTSASTILDICNYYSCVDGSCDSCMRRYGNNCHSFSGIIQTEDILCAVTAFGNYCACPNADIVGPQDAKGPSGTPIGTDDILATVEAFGGMNPFNCPVPDPQNPTTLECDHLSSGPPPAADACDSSSQSSMMGGGAGSSAMSAAPGGGSTGTTTEAVASSPAISIGPSLPMRVNRVIAAGQNRYEVDVFASRVRDVAGYDVCVEGVGAAASGLTFTGVRIDTHRPDYIFKGIPSYPLFDDNLGRIGGVVADGTTSVSSGPRSYLGTFVFTRDTSVSGSMSLRYRSEFTNLWAYGIRRIDVPSVGTAQAETQLVLPQPEE